MTKLTRPQEDALGELERAGYLPSTATALALIDDDMTRADVRRTIPDSGIQHGKPLAYFIALVAHGLTAGNYPSCPKGLRPGDATIIQNRAADAVDAIKKAKATKTTAKAQQRARTRAHREAEDWNVR